MDLQIHLQLAQVLNEVVGERIVVVDDQNHWPPPYHGEEYCKIRNCAPRVDARMRIRRNIAPRAADDRFRFDPGSAGIDYSCGMEQTQYSPPVYNPPPEPTTWDRIKKWLGPIGVVLVVIGKFFAKLKFLLLPLVKY